MSTRSKGRKDQPEGDGALADLGATLAGLLAGPGPSRQPDALTEMLVRRSGLAGGVLLANRQKGAEPVVDAAAGLAGLRERAVVLKAARTLAAWVVATREPVLVLDPGTDERIEARDIEASALVAVPVLVFGEPLGALVGFWSADESDPDPDRAFPVLEAVASVAGLLLRMTTADGEIRDQRKRVKDLEAERLRLDRLARTGETTVEVIVEIQKSTSAIAGFARRVLRGLPENDINREYLDVTIGEIERLERLLADQRKASSPPDSPLGMAGINEILQAVLDERREAIVSRKARVLKRLAVGLPKLLLDRARIRSAFENILDHLIETVPRGGRLKVESKRTGDLVQIVVAADGARTAGGALDRLFVPFHSGSPDSGPLGLVAACRIVREHGAEIGVRSDGEWPALFLLNFPIKENEERRKSSDRRTPRADRRRRRDAA